MNQSSVTNTLIRVIQENTFGFQSKHSP